jgi:internalin A
LKAGKYIVACDKIKTKNYQGGPMKDKPVVVTEPAAVAALKRLYEALATGSLEWDFSIAGRVKAKDGSLTATGGVLTGLDLGLLVSVEILFGAGELPYCMISDVSPLTKLTKLTRLDLASNKISDVSPLAKLTKLTDLQLGLNKISDVSPLAKLTKLTWLDLQGTKVNDLSPLAEPGLGELREIFLKNCPVTDFSPLSRLPKLEKVNRKAYKRPRAPKKVR